MKIEKAEDMKLKKSVINGLIYGQPGVGKTTLALSAPKPLILDCEDSVIRAPARFRADTVRVIQYEDIKFTAADLVPYETILVDTLDAFIEIIDRHLRKNEKFVAGNGGLTLQGYGARKIKFGDFVFNLRNMGKKVVFISHEKEIDNGNLRVLRPDIPDSAMADVLRCLDFVGYMYMVGDKRTISFTPNERFYAKNSYDLPASLDVPPIKDKNTFLSEVLFPLGEQNRSENAKEAEEYNKILAEGDKIIAGQTDIMSKTIVIFKLPVVWDSKAQLWGKLCRYAKSQGYKWDNKTWVK